MNMNQEPKT